MAEPNEPTPDSLSGTDNTLQIAVLGHLLRAERSQTESTIDTMAALLKDAIPDRIEITLTGWALSRNRTVQTLTITFDDASYHIAKSKHGAPKVTRSKIVRDITLKSSEVSMETCITEVVAKLSELEKQSAATRVALSKFVNGR